MYSSTTIIVSQATPVDLLHIEGCGLHDYSSKFDRKVNDGITIEQAILAKSTTQNLLSNALILVVPRLEGRDHYALVLCVCVSSELICFFLSTLGKGTRFSLKLRSVQERYLEVAAEADKIRAKLQSYSIASQLSHVLLSVECCRRLAYKK